MFAVQGEFSTCSRVGSRKPKAGDEKQHIVPVPWELIATLQSVVWMHLRMKERREPIRKVEPSAPDDEPDDARHENGVRPATDRRVALARRFLQPGSVLDDDLAATIPD